MIKPLKPSGPGWEILRYPVDLTAYDYPNIEVWRQRILGILVFSSVFSEKPGEITYHISMSFPSQGSLVATDANWVLDKFDANNAKENTPANSRARHFFKTVKTH